MGVIFLAMGACFAAMAVAAYFLIREVLSKREPKAKPAKPVPTRRPQPSEAAAPPRKVFGKGLLKAKPALEEEPEEPEEPVYERRRSFATLRSEIDHDQRHSGGGGPQAL